MTNAVVQSVWEGQNKWSAAAGELKSGLVRWRSVTLTLGMSGAFLETLAAQMPAGTVRQVAAWSGAVCLLLVPILTQRLLALRTRRAWVRARSASEALKTEIFRFLARAAPYEDQELAPELLRETAREIENAVDDLGRHAALAKPVSSTPLELSSPDEYLEKRVDGQIGWYRQRARENARKARRFRNIELALATAAGALGAAAGVWGDSISFQGGAFLFGPWVAVLTTIGGALTTHIAASRYDSLATSYFATARRLQHLRSGWPPRGGGTAPSRAWSEFVNACENAISVENEGWMAEWTEKEEG